MLSNLKLMRQLLEPHSRSRWRCGKNIEAHPVVMHAEHNNAYGSGSLIATSGTCYYSWKCMRLALALQVQGAGCMHVGAPRRPLTFHVEIALGAG